MSRITFLNHSCIRIESDATAILCDPWFVGAAFDNGWRLLAEGSHDLNKVPFDWVWLSHEHPDHFSIPTLKQLKRPSRFIYQATSDRKVRNYLVAQGHEVSEVNDADKQVFGDIACQTFLSDGYDSAALFELPDGRKVLNVNDCRVESAGMCDRLAAAAAGPVDLLTMQFSYANWAGNPGDGATPRYQHELVMERLFQAIEAFKPKATLLFASYVYFSHVENFHWNDYFWLDEVVAAISPMTKVIIPKPDQVIDLDNLSAANFDASNKEARDYWSSQHDTRQPVDFPKERLSLDDIKEEFARFHRGLWTENDLATARQTGREAVTLDVKVTDLDQTLRLSLYDGSIAAVPDGAFDIAVSSEVLRFLFRNKFGRGTLTINSRVKFNYRTAYRFFVFFFVSYANNIGKRLAPGGGLEWKHVRSVTKTIVLDSIFRAMPEAKVEFDEFIDGFLAAAPS